MNFCKETNRTPCYPVGRLSARRGSENGRSEKNPIDVHLKRENDGKLGDFYIGMSGNGVYVYTPVYGHLNMENDENPLELQVPYF